MATPKVSAKIIKSTEPIKKAEVSTQVVTESNSGADFITPPYDLRGFKILVNNSSILPQCIRAYKNNIAGFGISIKYKEDFGKETKDMKAEWQKLESILKYFNLDCDTKEIFEDLIEARETYGIAYLEVIRNNAGEVVGGEFINNTPSVMKTVPLDPYVEVEYEADGKVQKRRKRFCKYKQELNGKTVYFKEMGDPRVMDLRDGQYYEKGKGVPIEFQANEIQEFVIGTEPYGETRWLGTTLNVDGSRKAENLNNRYFVEGRHTPLMILIRGGTLTEESFTKLQTYMDDIKGESGQHAFVVLETENLDNRTDMEGEQKPDLEIVKMADVLQNDELFQNYLDNNRHKVQSSFLLPDLYVGYTSDFNRATAQTAQEITEKQVFQPERQSLAWVINNKLLADYHFKYVEVYFLEPDMSNPDDLAKLLSICNMAGGLTPNKAKEILYEALGETAENFDGDWADLPMAYLQMQAGGGEQGAPEGTPEEPAEEVPEKPDAKLDEQISQQIEKSVEHNDAEITAVLKEIRKLLIESQENEEKAFTFIGKSDIIKEWDEGSHPRDEKGRFSSTGRSSSGTGETEPCTGFASEKLFNKHFDKHIDEFGDLTKEEYLQKGIDFLKQACKDDVVGYMAKDGKVVRFNTKTTEYATGYPGKQICTYFKAKYDKKHGREKVETANNYYERLKKEDEGKK